MYEVAELLYFFCITYKFLKAHESGKNTYIQNTHYDKAAYRKLVCVFSPALA